VSFTIEAGQTCAFIGPSGAGKSTILKLIAGLLRPSSGRILIDGQDVACLASERIFATCALVSTDLHLFDRSIYENIELGGSIPSADVKRAIEVSQLTPVAQACAGSIGIGGMRLSAGERQRLAIARATVRDAPILILDEATGALDAVTEAAVLAGLRHGHSRRTTVVAAHRAAAVADADLVLTVEKGRVVAGSNTDACLEK
jgi:ABC-type multidrug transport system fused ATPase/permease subunit